MIRRFEARYLRRKAAIYARWSTERQVQNSKGSRVYQTQSQWDLALLAGYVASHIVMYLDEGITGRTIDRPEYQALLRAIRAGEIGAVFMFEVSRGGRGEIAWFEFLELLARYDVLLVINGQVVDPRDEAAVMAQKFQGIFAARESRLLLQRMHGGRLAVARHGRAVSYPPAGYEPVRELHDGELRRTGEWQKVQDPAARAAIEAVFCTFRRERSLAKSVRALRREGVSLPMRAGRRGIVPRPPTVYRIRNILKNPVYYGVYVYAKKHWQKAMTEGDVPVREGDVGDYVVLEDHHEGYVSREEFDQIQRTLAINRRSPSQAYLGGGPALLQGRIRCAAHGAMSPRYGGSGSEPRASYGCLGIYLLDGSTQCVTVPETLIIRRIVKAVLERLAVPSIQSIRAEWQRERAEWRMNTHRLDSIIRQREIDAVKIRRRIRDCELQGLDRAAHALAEDLEGDLTELERLRTRAAAESPPVDPFTEAHWTELVRLSGDVQAIWAAVTTTNEDRKQLLRLLISAVVIEHVDALHVDLSIQWLDGAAATKLTFIRPLGCHQLLWTWHEEGIDIGEMVSRLAGMGARTQQGNPWSRETVQTTIRVLQKRGGPQVQRNRPRKNQEDVTDPQ